MAICAKLLPIHLCSDRTIADTQPTRWDRPILVKKRSAWCSLDQLCEVIKTLSFNNCSCALYLVVLLDQRGQPRVPQLTPRKRK